jgi:mono/diheme cytochrome c family protein
LGGDSFYNLGMKSSTVPFYLLMIVLLAAGIANAQTTVKKVSAKPTVAIDGKVLFHDYCAVCHGVEGKGNGPAASAMKAAPSDLTQIARRNNGRFDDERILRILRGEESVGAHGSKDMPMWGGVFNNMGSNPSMVQTRVHALVQYLDQVQVK